MESIRKLEPLERELSHLLGDVTIERPTHVCLEAYRRWLEKYCELCRRRPSAFPVVYGATLMLTGYAVLMTTSVHSSNGWVFSPGLLLFHRCGEDFPSLTESGSILVPVSFPVQRLVAFINTSHCKAKQLKSEYERSVTFQLLFGT